MNEHFLKAQQGDRQAFEALIRAHAPRLLSWLRGRTPSDIDAEDILQEVLFSLHRNLSGINSATKLNGWLFSAARRQLMTRVDKRNREQEHIEKRARTARTNPTDPRLDLIHEAVAELPEKLEEVILTYYSSRITYHQAGALLGLPETTVQSRLRKALTQLKSKLLTGALS